MAAQQRGKRNEAGKAKGGIGELLADEVAVMRTTQPPVVYRAGKRVTRGQLERERSQRYRW